MTDIDARGRQADAKPDPKPAQPGATTAIAKMPGATGFDLEQARRAADGDSDLERNKVFSSLVTADDDIVGLVAYSIYKQNKHDWLVAFSRAKSREPDEAESAAYIIGECTPRRLATYRHLAEATLEGRGPQVAAGGVDATGVRRVNFSPAAPAPSSNVAAWIVAGAAAIVALVLLAYFVPRLMR